jgi:hypothetical protein
MTAPIAQTTPESERNAVERQRIDARRAHWDLPPLAAEPVVAGLAFSGGGIRSATFALGLTQSLAARATPVEPGHTLPMLARFDYLSTVSGGGYTGAFLGTLFLPRHFGEGTIPDPDRNLLATETARDAGERTLSLLRDPAQQQEAAVGPGSLAGGRDASAVFHPLRWLRENGRYLAPGGAGDRIYMAAFYLRALIGVHYVLSLMLVALMTATYGGRLLLHALGADRLTLLNATGWTALLPPMPALAWWWSGLIVLPLAVVAAAIGPLVLAYWAVYRQDRRERRSAAELVIEFGPWLAAAGALAAGAVLWSAGVRQNWLLPLLGYAVFLGVVAGLIRLTLDFLLQPRVETEPGRPTPSWRTISGLVQDARLKLTKWLEIALKAVLALFALALVDSLAQTLFVALLRGQPAELLALGSSGGVAALLLVAARKLAALVGAKGGWAELLARFAKPLAAVAAAVVFVLLAALAGALVQAVVWSHILRTPPVKDVALALGGTHAGLLAGLVLVLLVLLVMTGVSLGFLNNSTLHRFYAARLRRTYLGAANLRRLLRFRQAQHDAHTGGKAVREFFVSESHPDDEVSLRSYFGAASCAPLHLINVNLNERMSLTSALVRDDRRGLPLTVGPAGLQVNERFFAWSQATDGGSRIGSAVEVAVMPAAADAGAISDCERLPLSSWVAISGAAVATGLGRMSSTGFSLLTWLTNARLAYWWQAAAAMSTQRRASGLGTFDLVWQEMTGGFYGQRGLLWNLSDGGHFENTAVYELLRRRVALIVCADNGADPDYDFNDLQNLVRRARIDLGAELRFLTTEEAEALAESYCKPMLAPHRIFAGLEDFKRPERRAEACALLAEVSYPEGGQMAARSLLVVVKPTLLAAAPVDVKLYARAETRFPQQGTGDQFFDEAQWESYRRLGQTAGDLLAGYWPGLLLKAKALAGVTAPAD